jgi:hypothetical protein
VREVRRAIGSTARRPACRKMMRSFVTMRIELTTFMA